MFNFKIWVLFAGSLIVSGVNNEFASALTCDANSIEPDFHVYGIDFGPYNDDQNTNDYIPVKQIRERLEVVSPHTDWIRSFGATHGLEEIPAEAFKLGLDVAMGSWIRHKNNREAEIVNLVEKAEAGYVDIVVVGNEELYAYEEGNSDAIEPNELLMILRDVHARLDTAGLSNIPVTTAEPWYVLFRRDPNNFFAYQEIMNELDIFLVNVYPFHQYSHIDGALEMLNTLYSDIKVMANEAGPGKEVIISETGWPSDGAINGQAEPSLENAAR